MLSRSVWVQKMSLNLNSSDKELEKMIAEEEERNLKSAKRSKRLKPLVVTLVIMMIGGLTYWIYRVLMATSYDAKINEAVDARLNTHGAKTTAELDRVYNEVTTIYKGGGQYKRNEYTYSFNVNGETYSGEGSFMGSIKSPTINVVYDPESPNINKMENTSYSRYESLSSMYQGTFLLVGVVLILMLLGILWRI